jgi:hypothetical protein
MNPKATRLLIIMLAALGGYVYFFELDANEQPPTNSAMPLHQRAYGEYDLVGLRVERAGSPPFQFVRTAAGPGREWAMVAPNQLAPNQLDQVRVNGAAVRLGQLRASQLITAVTNLAQYGLDPAELTVTLTISDGSHITLYTGAETPVNDQRYLRTATNGHTVYLVFGFAIDDLLRLWETPPLKPLLTPSPP